MTGTIKLLNFSSIVVMTCGYIMVLFGVLHVFLLTLPGVLYDLALWVIAVLELSLHFGMAAGIVLPGALAICILRRGIALEGIRQPKLQHHLTLMMWAAPVMSIGLVIYGWTVQYRVHVVAPAIGVFIVGLGSFPALIISQSYLIGLYGSESAASALGASVFLRSLCTACLPSICSSMYARLNYGWGNTVLGLMVLLCTSVPWTISRFG
ncbi:hypothetical protein BO71DRAFT_428022 [Aspergillus ellipticus CBS 707.79]|uniref:MFS general substrate transporter n=1 Tax=Aspergillus ellipticus CBS 707.79 TaxID=1448320 RepID=A0A319DG46_9EURO|nr:hypothetical protein BO71DRAFT_428022 [Aspergillus ellipticus CBS 707.79]